MFRRNSWSSTCCAPCAPGTRPSPPPLTFQLWHIAARRERTPFCDPSTRRAVRRACASGAPAPRARRASAPAELHSEARSRARHASPVTHVAGTRHRRARLSLAHPTSARAQACVDDLTGAGGELGDRDRILSARAPVLVRVVPVHCARPCAEPLLRRRRGCSSAPLAHGTDGGAPDGRGAALDSAGANTCVEPVRGAAREGHAQPLWPLAVCGVRCAVVGAACVQSVCERCAVVVILLNLLTAPPRGHTAPRHTGVISQ